MTTMEQLQPLPPSQARQARGIKPKIITGGVVVLAVIALVASRATGENGSSLRTALARNRSVSKTVEEVGTIEPVSAASVAFPIAGTVATVNVTKGATVTRGQTLATLDTSDLQRAVNAAKAQLAQAKLTLADAIAGNNESNNNNSQVSAQAADELNAVRQAVLEAQQQVDRLIGEAQAAYESAQSICEAVSADTVATCQAALTDVLSAQQATAQVQQALVGASNAYDSALSEKESSPSSNGNNSQPQGNTTSAADLVAMQKDIDAAQAALAVANQNVSAATIVSPIDGTVESLTMKVGDAVTASSTASVIKVIGPNGFEVTTIVAVEKLANIKLGQKATVTPDGSNQTQDGEVVAIGAPRTSNGATSYPVSIGLDDDDSLRNGSVASVSITTGSAAEGVAVPTSAVHTDNGQSTVTVAKNGKLEAVTVTVGVVGKAWTQIKSGLQAGDRVVIADLDQALPDSATDSSNNGTGERNGANTFVGPPIQFNGGTGSGPMVQVGPPGG